MSRMESLLWAVPCGLLALSLAACGQQDEAQEQAAEPEPGPVQVWSFDRATGEDSMMGNRLPASPDQTVLVPATTLFPGGARVDPGIENPFAGDAAAIAAGKRHFAAFNCAGCHAPLGGGGMGPPLSDDDWIYGDYREPNPPARVIEAVAGGDRGSIAGKRVLDAGIHPGAARKQGRGRHEDRPVRASRQAIAHHAVLARRTIERPHLYRPRLRRLPFRLVLLTTGDQAQRQQRQGQRTQRVDPAHGASCSAKVPATRGTP